MGAQAARLNLRMQKELKLLLTDPPPSSSFPHLSHHSLFSLSSIIAHIEGPEDTVYANGVFKINIQIPERYPFQPPTVTFATPIYHPNIDTGGRICLDILNLPPKGAWQPSLNISTVLTSILLLLTEPNPDDGLMCEASKEYKYNRQAFDQKARSMTEKYARAGATENGSCSQNTESHLKLSTRNTEGPHLSKVEVDESLGKLKKLSPTKSKLSLISTSSNLKRVTDKIAKEAFSDDLLGNQIEGKTPNQQPAGKFNSHQNNGELHSTSRKLSLESSSRNKKLSVQYKENVLSYQSSPVLKPKDAAMGSTECVLLEKNVNHYEQPSHHLHESRVLKSVGATCKGSVKIRIDQSRVSSTDNTLPQPLVNPPIKQSLIPLPMPSKTSSCSKLPQKDCVDKTGSGLFSIKHKRLGLPGRKPSLGLPTSLQSQEKDNKENMISVSGVLLSSKGSGGSLHKKIVNSNSNVYPKKQLGMRRKLTLEPLDKSNWSNDGNIQLNSCDEKLNGNPSKLLRATEESRHIQKLMEENDDKFTGQIKHHSEVLPISDSAIVEDSEDSDDDKKVTVRHKLSLKRKRLIGKWNVKA
ncbi:hypothetical protein AgCh_006309 [Apium graveolens]